MATSLFPSLGGGAAGRSSNTPQLVELKAGRCVHTALPNGNFNVVSDPRRGVITMSRGNDRMLHFKWTDRSSGTVEEDRLVFPSSATFKRIKTPNEADRVYVFTQDNQHILFWLQDKSSEKDTEVVDKINHFIANPQAIDAALAAMAAANAADAGAAAGVGGLPGTAGLGPDAWMNLMGLSRGAGAGAGAPAAASSSSSAAATAAVPAPLGGLDLSSILSSIQQPAAPAAAAPSAAVNTSGVGLEQLRSAMMGITPATQRQPELQLQDIFTAEQVLATGILSDPSVRAALVAQLPEGQQTEENLEAALRSPQLSDAMRSLSRALQGESFASILASFGMNPSDGNDDLARGNAVAGFLAALREASRRDREGGGQ